MQFAVLICDACFDQMTMKMSLEDEDGEDAALALPSLGVVSLMPSSSTMLSSFGCDSTASEQSSSKMSSSFGCHSTASEQSS